MATAKKKQQKKDSNLLVNAALILASALALLFVYSVAGVMQEVIQRDILGAPNTYAAVAAVLLGLYAFAKSTSEKQRYTVVAVVTTIIVGGSLWFLGVTSAGQMIDNEVFNMNHKTCGCAMPPRHDN